MPDTAFWWTTNLAARGGVEPHSWRLADGASLPGELALEESGWLGGYLATTNYGEYAFSVIVSDGEGTETNAVVTLLVEEDPDHAPVIESAVPEVSAITIRAGETATFGIVASDPDGDEIETTWSLYDDEWNWIADLEPQADGTVAFSPAEGEEGEYFVRAWAEAAGRGVSRDWRVTVVPADAIVVDQNLPHAVEGVPYSVQLTATGGTAPYVWGMEETAYPDGEIAFGGLLEVWTEQWELNGSSVVLDFPIIVADANGNTATQTVCIVMDPNPNQRPAIDAISPAWDEWDESVLVGETRTFSVEAHDPEGGPLMFEWTLDGEPLEETGVSWTWTPVRADIGEHELQIRCFDGERFSSTWDWWFQVVPAANDLVADVSLPVAVAGEPYSAAFSVSGGTEPYAWGAGFAMSRDANSFAGTGTAQDWSEDDGCWEVSLPFAFPFYGGTYDTIWVSDNGTICLDGGYSNCDFTESGFKNHALIAPLWTDLDGTLQTVFIDDSVSGRITIRWEARYYGSEEAEPGASFSATLCADGTIRFSYGEEAQAGAVGVSAGDGVRFLRPATLQDADLGGADDIVFRPATFAPGVSLSADGTVSGAPTAAGTYRVPVSVVDDEGDGAVLEREAAEGRCQVGALGDDVTRLVRERGELGDGLAAAENGRPTWSCYVADLNPEDLDDDLVASIELVDGKPEVRIERGESANRVYTTQGAKTLGGGWTDLENGADWNAAGYRFFRVKVEMP